MNIAFRVDASPRLGIGHLMRCLTLADALKERGARTRFVCRPLPGDYADVLADRGHEFAPIHLTSPVTELVDAECSTAALSGRRWDWVVVDDYALGASWEGTMRVQASRIFVIDDLANRDHDCEILLDQNHLPDGVSRYRGRVPASCEVLVGPGFALLRPEYRLHRENLKPRGAEVGRVLISFGGTDPRGLTELALDALSAYGLRHLLVDLVGPADPSRRSRIERQAAERPGTTVHGPRPHLADLMAQADLALGGGGATTWERMCLGLPSLVISMADNQLEVVDYLNGLGLVRLVGRAETVTVEQIQSALRDEIRALRTVSTRDEAMRICDGRGTTRAVDAMLNVSIGVGHEYRKE